MSNYVHDATPNTSPNVTRDQFIIKRLPSAIGPELAERRGRERERERARERDTEECQREREGEGEGEGERETEREETAPGRYNSKMYIHTLQFSFVYSLARGGILAE